MRKVCRGRLEAGLDVQKRVQTSLCILPDDGISQEDEQGEEDEGVVCIKPLEALDADIEAEGEEDDRDGESSPENALYCPLGFGLIIDSFGALTDLKGLLRGLWWWKKSERTHRCSELRMMIRMRSNPSTIAEPDEASRREIPSWKSFEGNWMAMVRRSELMNLIEDDTRDLMGSPWLALQTNTRFKQTWLRHRVRQRRQRASRGCQQSTERGQIDQTLMKHRR